MFNPALHLAEPLANSKRLNLDKTKEIYLRIKEVANSQYYLEEGDIDHMGVLYPFQKLEFEEWEHIQNIISDWTQTERQVIADAIIQIKDNKKSNYDTASIFGNIFVLSDDSYAESMINDFSFIDNQIPKKIELIDKLRNKLEILEEKNLTNRNYKYEYDLIDKLYNESVY